MLEGLVPEHRGGPTADNGSIREGVGGVGGGGGPHQAAHRLVGAEWVILQGLRTGQLCEDVPVKFEGYIMKSRKWPMKGWHKVYAMLSCSRHSYIL